MAKSDFFENALLALIFNATAVSGIAEDASIGANTELYFSLHTADPGEAGDQTTNEIGAANYTNYARIGVSRSGSGFTVTGSSVSPVADVLFAAAVSGDSGTLTHCAIGLAASGAGEILYSEALSSPITLAEGIEPKIKNSSSVTES